MRQRGVKAAGLGLGCSAALQRSPHLRHNSPDRRVPQGLQGLNTCVLEAAPILRGGRRLSCHKDVVSSCEGDRTALWGPAQTMHWLHACCAGGGGCKAARHGRSGEQGVSWKGLRHCAPGPPDDPPALGRARVAQGGCSPALHAPTVR